MNSNNTQLIELKKNFTEIENQKKKYESIKSAYFSSSDNSNGIRYLSLFR